MRKNHISGKMKQILAVACAAMLAVSSVPANTVAYASETETTQEAEVQNDNKGAGENNDVDNTNESNDVTNETSESGKSEEETSESSKSGEEASESGKSGETSESGKSGEEASESGKSGEETSESGKSGKETSESGKSGEETSESGKSGEENKNDTEPEQDTTNPKVTAVELSEDKIKITIDEEPSEDGWTISCKKDGEIKTKDKITGKSFTIDPKEYWNEDGTYTDFQINGEDASGNPLEFGKGLKDKLKGIKITIDTKAPKVTAVELSGDKEKIEITIEEENNSEDGWTYSCKKDGEGKSKTVKTNKFTIDPKTEWGDGTYTDFQISGEDASGKSLEFGEGLEAKLKEIKITIDKNAPEITNTKVSIDNNEAVNLNNSYDISFGQKIIKYSFEVKDNHLSAVKWTVSSSVIEEEHPDTSSWTPVVLDNNKGTFNVNVPSKGYVYVYAADSFGNNKVNGFKALVVENDPPSIEAPTITYSDETNGRNPIIKLNKITDKPDVNYSGIREIYYTIDADQQKHYIYGENATAPTSISELTQSYEKGAVLDLSELEGKHTIHIHAFDWCSNEGKYDTAELLFDHKAPEIDITPNGLFVNYEENNVTKKVTKDGTFDITIKDDKDETETDIHTGTYSITVNGNEYPDLKDQPYTSEVNITKKLEDLHISTDGGYTIEVTAKDKAGNPAVAQSFTFVVDTTPPKATCEVITQGDVPSDYLVFNADSLEGKEGVEIKFTVEELHMDPKGWECSYDYTVDGKKKTNIVEIDDCNGADGVYEFTVFVGKDNDTALDGWYDNFRLSKGKDVVNNSVSPIPQSPEFLISTEIPTITIDMSDKRNGIYHNDGGFTVDIALKEPDPDDEHQTQIEDYTIEVSSGDTKYTYPHQTSGFGRKINVVIEDKYLSDTFGEDAEKELTVKIHAKSSSGNETSVFSEVNSANGRIDISENGTKGTFYYDKVAPKLVSVESEIESTNDWADFFYGGDELYYVSAQKVTDTYTISEAYLYTKERPAQVNVSYQKDGEDFEVNEVTTLEEKTEHAIKVELEGDGKYEGFRIIATDLAGNKLVKSDKYASRPDYINQLKNDAQTEGIELTYGKVLDTQGPSVTFEATPRTDDDSFEEARTRRYYNSSFNGTFTVEDKFGLSSEDEFFTAVVLKANDTDDYNHDYSGDDFDNPQVMDYTQASDKKIVFSKDVEAGNEHINDGLYRFYIEGFDKAHNRIVATQAAESTGAGEMALSKYNDGLMTYDKVLDTVAPLAELNVLESENAFYTLKMSPDNYSLEVYKPFQKLIDSTIRIGTSDKSPVYLTYNIESTVPEGSKSGITTDYSYGASSIEEVKAREQIITIKDLIIKDRAGNLLACKGDPKNEVLDDSNKRTLHASNDLIFDDTKQTEKDSTAPTATIKATSDVTHRNADGRDLFNQAVTLKVTITDPGADVNSSGLKNASYAVYVDGVKADSGSYSYRTNSSAEAFDGTNATAHDDTLTFVSEFTVNLPTSYQTNDIEVRVNALDNSGNKMDTQYYRCGIDTVGPEITVSYKNNSAQNGKYFKANRTAIITVIDRNVSNDGIKINTQGSIEGSFAYSKGSGNGANDKWVKKVYYTKDGDYTLNLSGSRDALGNKATIKYTGTAPQNFVIDKTAPVIVVKFNNDNVQNGKYYKDPRTAQVQITEHNFRASDVSIKTQVTPGGFGNAGDVHTANVYYGTDGVYTMVVNYTDLAGNPAKAVTVDEFVIDRTIPVIYVTFDNNSSQNGKYYKDPRTATVRIHEHNFRASEVKINQTANIQKGNVSAPGVSGFGGGGDDHSASINYSNDGNYTIEVNYTDLAGNPAKVVKVDEFVIDRTKPVVKFVTPDKNNMVFQDAIAPQIEYSDINTTRGMASISLKGMKKSNVLEVVEDTFSDYQGTVRFENLKKVRENDDIYIATAVVTDLAGNEESVSITFSVNRFGSTYDYNNDSFTTNLVQNYFTNQEGDVVLREINVNKLTERSLTLYKDGDNRKLVEGTDFKVDENTVNGHYEYIYTIFAKNFEEEGNYNIIATSKDEAKNTNSNSSVKGNDGSNEVPLRFAIDKTEPSNEVTGVDITKNKFTESEITLDIRPLDNMNAVAKFLVRVLDKDKNVLQEFEMSGEELAKYLEEHDGVYQLTVEQNTGWQTIEIVTTDAAGNTSTDYTIADNTAYNVLVTPNLFVQYINRLPLVLLTVAAVAGIIFFIIWKRKKDQEDETAA